MPLIPRRSVIKSGHTDATNATNASFPLYPVEGKNTNERERKRKGGERYRGKEALVALVVYATENRLCGFLSDADGENRLRTRFPLLLIFEREREEGGENGRSARIRWIRRSIGGFRPYRFPPGECEQSIVIQ